MSISRGTFLKLLAGYLAIFTISLWPYASLLYSNEGLLPLAMSWPQLPGVAGWESLFSPFAIHALLGLSLVFCVLLAVQRYVAISALGLFLIQWILLNRNIWTNSPEWPYVLWILFSLFLLEWKPRWDPWIDRPKISLLAWVVLGASYSFSGWTKLSSLYWLDGTILSRVLSESYSRNPIFADILVQIPLPLLTVAAHLILVLEIAALPLLLWRITRWPSFFLFTVFHVILLLAMNFHQLSAGMLLFHAYAWYLAKDS